MIKLEKTKLNELLYYIKEDHFKNSLILQLIYAYGRNASEVFNLKPEDINLTDNTITFDITTKKITYPLLPTSTTRKYKRRILFSADRTRTCQ